MQTDVCLPWVTDDSVLLPAEVAYQCLESIPLVEKDATDLLDGWAAFLEWQSDPTYKANPPDGYMYPGFDYMQAVYDLRNRVTSGNITRELDLQDGIQDILFSSNDGHLNFLTDFNGVIQFERQVGLVAVSVDGQAVPQVYTLGQYFFHLQVPLLNPDSRFAGCDQWDFDIHPVTS